MASPVLASYDPDPDYFFHWYRDSAVVMDALRILYERGTLGDEALQLFEQFVQFSLGLDQLDGRTLVQHPQWRERVQPDFVQYLRPDAELAAGPWRAHPRRNAPQCRWHAGYLQLAAAAARWHRHAGTDADALAAAADARTGLARERHALAARGSCVHARGTGREPSYDIWEEDLGTALLHPVHRRGGAGR